MNPRASRRLLAITAGAVCAVTSAFLVPTAFAAQPHESAKAPAPYLGRLVPTAPVAFKARTAPGPTPLATPQAHLPAATTAELSLTAATSGAGWQKVSSSSLSVTGATPGAGQTRVSKVKVEVLDAGTVRKLGLSGLVLRLARTDRGVGAGPVRVQIPRSLLDGLYGAEYTSRIRWVELPGTMTAAGISSGAIKPTTLGYAAAGTGNSTLTPQVSAKPLLVAAAGSTTSTSGGGTWNATSLRSTSSWQVSTQTGDFSWNYPLRVPPAAAGPTPNLSLSYSSASIDGLTASTNNQSSVAGEGWQLAGTGFIERSYLPCAKDGTNLPAEQAQSGDLCWNGNDVSISFAGHSGLLVPAGGGDYRIEGDDGSRVSYGSFLSCNDTGHDAGCWRLTTQDGTSYYFGRSANSAWTVPVYGNDASDECHNTTFATSVCTQVWRWNLDTVQDIHGNTEKFFYTTEANYYHRDGGSLVSYIRGGYLNEIDYGMPTASSTVTEKVLFTYDKWGRCSAASESTTTCSLQNGSTFPAPPVPANYPDVPWDQNCVSGGACTGLNSPTFWTTQRLSSIGTWAMVSGTLTNADTWTLAHQYYPTGDSTTASMTLYKISHTSLPDTVFAYALYQNRVMLSGGTGLSKRRLTQITLDTGGTIGVTYGTPDCTPTSVTSINPSTNNHECYPVYWDVPGSTTDKLDWFNKYPVSQITANPSMSSIPDYATVTTYTYASPAWRLDRSPSTLSDHRTWSDFAGFKTAEVRVGNTQTPTTQLSTDYTYLQGMNGDIDASGNARTASLTVGGHTITDSRWWSGHTVETITHASGGSGGSASDVLTDTVSIPWAQASTPTMTYTEKFADPTQTSTNPPPLIAASPTVTAYLTGEATNYAGQTQADGSTKTVTTTNQFDNYGRTTSTQVDTPDAGSTCTSTTWDTQSTLWLLDLPGRVTNTGKACGAQLDYTKDIISDTRYTYDTSTPGGSALLTNGNLVETDIAKDYTGSSPNWVATQTTPASTGYDAQGRALSVTDANGATTTTVYGPLTGGPVTSTKVTRSAPGLSSLATTTNYSPLWGSPTSISDPNGNLTTASYDALGRLTSVWMPDRPLATGGASHTGTASIAYAYTQVSGKPLVTQTTKLNSTGGTYSTYSFADGLGRSIQTQAPMDGEASTTGAHQISGSVVSDTFYDYTGAVSQINNAYGSPSVPSANYLTPSTSTLPPSATEYSYDGAGRKTADLAMGSNTGDHNLGELWRTSYSYSGTNRVDQTPPAGGTPTTTLTDSLGRVTSLDQYLNTVPSGTSQRTSYGYDARGDMTSMSDQVGHQWSWTFDARGLQIRRSDPDAGITKTTYTNSGLASDTTTGLTSDTDPGGNTIHLDYDAYGRKSTEKEVTGGTSTTVADWHYDSATLGLGLLDASHSYVTTPASVAGTYTQSIGSYDADGRPTATETSIPDWNGATANTAFDWTYGYDQAGNQSSVTDPAVGGLRKETVGSTYDLLNNLTIVGGTSQYLGDVTYTTTNQPSVMTFTNGNTSVSRAYTYDDKTARLTTLLSTASGATNPNYANHHYTYNAGGLLTSDSNTADGQQADTQCYRYDSLQELTDAWTAANSACTDPVISNIGGPAPYWQTYTYDTVAGNRKSLEQHATFASGTDQETTYSYGNSNRQQPHTLTSSVTEASPQGANAWTPLSSATYSYDASGNTVSRPNGQTLSWNKEGKLDHTTTASGSVQNVYDADGQLLREFDPSSGDTLFLGDTELRLPAGSSTPIATRTYRAANMPVAERSTTATAPTTSKLYWLNPSAFGQNTVGEEVDALNLTISRRYFDPFGNMRAGGVPWTSDHTFLNAPLNITTQTVHLGARDYDASVGHFLSVDPVIDTTDPEQANGYSYASNQPITESDATGLMVDNAASNTCDAACKHGVVSDEPSTYALDPSTSSLNAPSIKAAEASCMYRSGSNCTSTGINLAQQSDQVGLKSWLDFYYSMEKAEDPCHLNDRCQVQDTLASISGAKGCFKQGNALDCASLVPIGTVLKAAKGGELFWDGAKWLRLSFAAAKDYEDLEHVSEVADKIATGHANLKHAKAFVGVSQAELASVVRDGIENRNDMRELSGNRFAFYRGSVQSDQRGTIIVFNPNVPDYGSIYTDTYEYFTKTLH